MAAAGIVNWLDWEKHVEETRSTTARLIGATPEEIALVANTTTGISLVAEGFPWQSGDNVVTLADEFPSNQYPWLNLASRGVECRRVEVGRAGPDLAKIAAACDRRTRLIAVSWVGFASGYRLDLAAITSLAHERGALLFLDAIQGLGVFPLDLRQIPIDFLAADGHKWMLGPEGAGIFFVRRQHLDLLRPLMVGWHSVERSMDFDHIELQFRSTAARYEGGTANMAGMIALGASLRLLESAGLSATSEAVAERVLSLTDHLRTRLAEKGAIVYGGSERSCRSGIVSFDLPGSDLRIVKRQLLRAGVVVNLRSGRLRASPHAYNNEEDIERLIAAL